MKKCPFCAESILDDAIKCRYCGSIVDGSQPTVADFSSSELLDRDVWRLLKAGQKAAAVRLVCQAKQVDAARGRAYVESIDTGGGWSIHERSVSNQVASPMGHSGAASTLAGGNGALFIVMAIVIAVFLGVTALSWLRSGADEATMRANIGRPACNATNGVYRGTIVNVINYSAGGQRPTLVYVVDRDGLRMNAPPDNVLIGELCQP